jgi:hypothetical protein
MGSKRKFKDWIDDYGTKVGRRWAKHYTRRLDRIEGKEQIQEQLEDDNNVNYNVGIANWVLDMNR